MRTRLPFVTALVSSLALTLAAGAAHATPDLAVVVSQPSGTSYVYSSVRYTVTVRNIGSPKSALATLQIDLPDTNTSPQVYPLGTVGAMATGCTRSGLRITCQVPRLNPGQAVPLYFDMNIPEAWQPVSFTATVLPGSAPDAQSNNDSQTYFPVLANRAYAIALTAPATVTNDHCTGTNLQSYYECTLFPSSISHHSVLFHPNGTITIPDAGPTYGGTWSQPTPDSLVFQYTDGGSPIVNFEGYGVGNHCFEGLTTFVPASSYSSPYRVCLP
ncbi:MAG: hypothetical protein U0324_05720 [Polyangiales bacterium]